MMKLMLGDCLEKMRDIPNQSVDLILTSPPYNKNGFRGKKDNSRGKGRWSGADISYGDYEDNKSEEEYKKWQIDILNEGERVLKENGSFFYNHKIRRANHKASHPFEWVIKSKLTFYQQIIWNRAGGPDHNIGYLDPTTELIFWLCKGVPLCNKNKKFSTEIWKFPPANNNGHPAPFPLTMAQIVIQMSSLKGQTVLDPFMGSGTTGVACKELGRNFIGIEIDKNYLELAERRINNTQESLF